MQTGQHGEKQLPGLDVQACEVTGTHFYALIYPHPSLIVRQFQNKVSYTRTDMNHARFTHARECTPLF